MFSNSILHPSHHQSKTRESGMAPVAGATTSTEARRNAANDKPTTEVIGSSNEENNQRSLIAIQADRDQFERRSSRQGERLLFNLSPVGGKRRKGDPYTRAQSAMYPTSQARSPI
jgi:hypothetical protein